MNRPLILLIVALLAGGPEALAQSKATNPWVLYAGGQVNYLTSRGNALLVRARAERNVESDYNALAGEQLQRAQVQLGYEWLLTERWSGGVVEKAVFDPNSFRTFVTGLFLRHSGHIGGLQFRKRVVLEHLARNQEQPNAAQLRLRFDLDRTFMAGKLGVRPRFSYDIQFDYDLQTRGADDPKPETRFIDHGYLRVELGLDVSPRLTLVPYVLRQTDFIVAVAQMGAVNQAGGDRNLRTPVVGFDVRYTLSGRKLDATRALPTFEGYQD